jgi:hypothetical protein
MMMSDSTVSRFRMLNEPHDGEVGGEHLCLYLNLPSETVEARYTACREYIDAVTQLLGPPAPPMPDGSPSGVFVFSGNNPICFLLRHAIEMALKIVEPGRGHVLTERLTDVLGRAAAHGMEAPDSFVEMVRDFARVDPGSLVFRYAADAGANEICCVQGERLRADVAILAGAVEGFLWELALLVHGGCGVDWSE